MQARDPDVGHEDRLSAEVTCREQSLARDT